MTRHLFIALVAFILVMATVIKPVFCAEGARPAQVTLGADLVRLLNQRYPGFRLAAKKDYCQNFEGENLPYVGRDRQWAYGALKGDFNGDQLDDYALIINAGRGYLWLAALKNKGVEPAYEITEFGEPFIRSDRIPATKLKGKICDGLFVIGGPGGLEGLNPSDYFGMENASSATQFYWKEGKWAETGHEP